MKTRPTLIAAAIVLALSASSANAGVKDWLKNKKEQFAGQHTSQAAQVSAEEMNKCLVFVNDYQSGKVERSPSNEANYLQCRQSPNTPKTLETVEVQGQRAPVVAPTESRAKKVMKRAGAGCAMGALMGLLTRNTGAIVQNCVVAGATMGITSFVEQMKDAHEVEQAAKDAGMKATVKSSTEQVAGKPVEKMQGVVIDYDKAEMEAKGEKVREVIDRMASLATKAKNNLTFTFEGSAKACRVPLDDLNARGVLARHKVVDLCGKSSNHRITITPVPDVD